MKLKQILARAQKEKWAVGQFNFSTLEQLRAILAAAEETKKPVILGTSEGEAKYFGIEEAVAIIEIARKKTKVEAFLNLDHGKDIDFVKYAIDAGYPAVHFDGSLLPHEENIKKTKEIVKYAKWKGVLVEGELGHIGGESAPHTGSSDIKASDLTPPDLAGEFAKKTGINSLAIAIGTSHGIYSSEPALDLARLKEISYKTNAFLVLHGGSGVPEDQIKSAIDLGIVKININTELRIIWKEELKKALIGEEAKPYKILENLIEPIKQKVVEKINLFSY